MADKIRTVDVLGKISENLQEAGIPHYIVAYGADTDKFYHEMSLPIELLNPVSFEKNDPVLNSYFMEIIQHKFVTDALYEKAKAGEIQSVNFKNYIIGVDENGFPIFDDEALMMNFSTNEIYKYFYSIFVNALKDAKEAIEQN